MEERFFRVFGCLVRNHQVFPFYMYFSRTALVSLTINVTRHCVNLIEFAIYLT